MSNTPTLHSRLRVLVAKTFRAEKLYASMKNSTSGEYGEAAKLSEFANSIRAEVWQQSHSRLRKALNDILTKSVRSNLIEEVIQLRSSFHKVLVQSKDLLDKTKTLLLEMAKKDEFAHSFKLSLDLIRFKAQAQASQIITDELTAIIQSSRKEEVDFRDGALPPEDEELSLSTENLQTASGMSNVVPFKRRIGSRFGRG